MHRENYVWQLPPGVKKMPTINISMSSDTIAKWKQLLSNYGNLTNQQQCEMDRMALNGFPDQLRCRAYLLISNAEDAMVNSIPLQSTLTDSQIHSFRGQIHNDVGRTFKTCTWMGNPQNRSRIEELLIRYVMVDEELGYTQGMNFFATVFVQVMDDCEAFWTMYNLFNDKIHNQSFLMRPGMSGLLHHLDMHKVFLKSRMPRISSVLERFNIEPILYAPAWFLSAGLGNPQPPQLLFLIMDRYVYFGQKSSHSLLLAFLKVQEQSIVNAKNDKEIFQAISNIGLFFFETDLTRFIDTWNGMMISQEEYNSVFGDDEDNFF